MKSKILVAAVVFLNIVPVGSLWAHHSFRAIFDIETQFTITGTLSKVSWRNPHIEIWLDVSVEGETKESWRFEGMSPAVFRAREVSKEKFLSEIGQPVTVRASPAREEEFFGSIWEVRFSDGSSVIVNYSDQAR